MQHQKIVKSWGISHDYTIMTDFTYRKKNDWINFFQIEQNDFYYCMTQF